MKPNNFSFKKKKKKYEGILNGNQVVVKELSLHEGTFFGKGTFSRSTPVGQGGVWQFPNMPVFPDPKNEVLFLTLQESFFLQFCFGILEVYEQRENMGDQDDSRIKLDCRNCWNRFKEIEGKEFIVRYVCYHFFRSKGWIVQSGIRYGCDYVLYKRGPGIDHAEFCVCIREFSKKMSWRDVCHQNRTTLNVAKKLIFCHVKVDGDITDPNDIVRKSQVFIIRTRRKTMK